MTVKELWAMTTYVGVVQIEDDEHCISNPIVIFPKGISEMILDDSNEYHFLADREVRYFDFLFNTMRIKIKE